MPSIMAKPHIEGFLADVRRANPDFNERALFGMRTSSLQGLLAHLRATSGNPQRFASAAAARAHCRNPNDPRLQKYARAIENLVGVWGTGSPYPGHEVAIGRVVFRGDRRPPAMIFTIGFQPWEPGALRYRGAQQDIDPATAVGISPQPDVAANFPLPQAWGPNAFRDASGLSWVYACFLERGYNTAGQQGVNFVGGNLVAGNLLYAGELASSSIPTKHVLGSIEVIRMFSYGGPGPRPPDWFARGTYAFVRGSWRPNPRYTGPADHTLIDRDFFAYRWQPFVRPGAPARGPMVADR